MVVASRYAKSLIGLAVEKGQLEAIHNDMKMIKGMCDTNPDFVNLLESPIVKTDKKKAIFADLFKGKVNEITFGFLNILADKRREGYVDDIAKSFDTQYKEYKNILSAVIVSAKGIDAATRGKVMDLVKSTTTGEVELIEKTDANILGGFVLTIGDKQIDQSVARKLTELRKNFTENPFVSEL